MDIGMLGEIGVGISFGFAVIGSVIGTVLVVPATIGAWKKSFVQNKPAPFIMVAFAGMPLTNIIYGFITMNYLAASVSLSGLQLFITGLVAGIGIGGAGYVQCYSAACASEAFAETGQGFGNYMMVLGICETVALFIMVFIMMFAG